MARICSGFTPSASTTDCRSTRLRGRWDATFPGSSESSAWRMKLRAIRPGGCTCTKKLFLPLCARMAFDVQIAGDLPVAQHFGSFIEIHIVRNVVIVAGDFIFLVADGFKEERVPGNVDIHLGDLPAAIADVGAVDGERTAGIKVSEQAPGELHGVVEATS